MTGTKRYGFGAGDHTDTLDEGNVASVDEIDGLDLAITTLENFKAVVPPSVWILKTDGESVRPGFEIALKILKRLQKAKDMQDV